MRTQERTAEGATVDDATVVDAASQTAQELPSFTRGLNPRAVIAWVRQLHGPDGERALLDALDARTIAALGGPRLHPNKLAWVPFFAHANLCDTVDRVFGQGDLALLRTVGRFMAFRDMPFVARPIAKLLSPTAFMDVGLRVWRFYNSHGTWHISRRTMGASATLSGMPIAHRAFCATLRGWAEGAILFSGATEVATKELRCVASGASSCAFEIEWK